MSQQPQFDESHVRFPSPNYNQNPSPFQLPTGRSQSGTQYYVNQPQFTAQRQRFKPAPPFNYQLVHPASTKKPDVSQIHSVAYQNDPSKPETFLGQITLNNPDFDYLQNTRFKNLPFDTNSLKSNGQAGHISHDEDIIDNDNQDLYDQHRVTTYNPNKLTTKQRLNIKPSGSRFSHFNTPVEEKTEFRITQPKIFPSNLNYKEPKANANVYQSSSTEYKALLDIEPLLEDDISDISSFRELMKNRHVSDDVQVIKSTNTEDSGNDSESDDSKPDASSMNTDNYLKEIPVETMSTSSSSTTTTTTPSPVDDLNEDNGEEEGEYVEYYDEPDKSDAQHTTKAPQIYHATEHEDIYDEYDSTEEPENSTVETKTNSTTFFDVLVMKTANTTVQDDNFKHFVDTTVIDQTEKSNNKENNGYTPNINASTSEEESTSIEIPSILGQEVVSVVTTKSVVNGTISIPDVTYAPSTTKIGVDFENMASLKAMDNSNESIPVTTENWIVVASVQTSRSVSGARFLPFPTVEQEEKKQVLADENDEDGSDEPVTKDPLQETSSSSVSTENINDKLDSIQSELSSAVLSGSLNNENKNIELITESTTESTTTSTTTTTTTTALPNVFTLKSTLPSTFTERSSPEPLPVQIKKFAHRVTTSSTTPKPRKKPSFVTIMDDLSPGLLPRDFKPRHSYKDKRTSTTTTSTTTTTTSTTTQAPFISSEITNISETQGRSSGISSKNKVIVLDDKSLLPREYSPKEQKLATNDLSKLLPPGYKVPASTLNANETKINIFDKTEKLDISTFLPKNLSRTTEIPVPRVNIPANAIPVDISALLPPGFNLNSTVNSEEGESILNKIKVVDVLSLLPPGFTLNQTDEEIHPSSTTKAPGGIKLVFPSRPGGKLTRKTTTAKPLGSLPLTPKIQKGWPTR